MNKFNTSSMLFNNAYNITPKITYCMPVWGHIAKTDCALMDHILQRALRVVLHDKSASLEAASYDVIGRSHLSE